MNTLKKTLNSRGETLIELLIAAFIIGMTLTVVLSAFMSGRQGIASAWDRTEDNLCAASVMEQLKAADYENIENLLNHGASNVTPADIPISVDGDFVDYEIKIRLSAYQPDSAGDPFPTDEIIQVKVQVRTGGHPWLEKTSLIRKGDSS